MINSNFGVAKYETINEGWRSMNTAPRDGTWVELKCSYGIAPWYCVARWTDEHLSTSCQTGFLVPYKSATPSWVKRGGGGPSDENSLSWRPYEGVVEEYVDPTGGAQDTQAYWMGASLAKYRH